MKQYQCARLHLYNVPDGEAGETAACPVCAAEAEQAALPRTRGIWTGVAADDDPDATVEPAYDPRDPRGLHGRLDPQAAQRAHAALPTVGVYAHLGVAQEPVVGWLVCIAGPERGRDWRLVSGRNTLGRGEGMAVRLAADMSVSRERHAVISFEPRRRAFSLAPGEGQALVYCNGEEVAVPRALAANDRIELGTSVLVFVPLDVAWDELAAG